MNAADPKRILLAGDVHGNSRWMGTLCKLARRLGCDAILQLGDFGYWPHTADGLKFLSQVTLHAERHGIDCVYWVDGNHENHDALANLEPDEDGMVTIVDRCRYLPRGHRWQWAGVRFGALGGAFSVDHAVRQEGTSWWRREVLTDADVERLGQEPLDVLVTHDAPDGMPLRGFPIPQVDEILSREVRIRILQAIHATQPKLVVHGHWHHRYSHQLEWPESVADDLVWRTAQVEGLGADIHQDNRAWAVLDLSPLCFSDARDSTPASRPGA